MNILQPATDIIEAVFTISVSVIFPGNGYRIELSGQQIPGVLKCEAHLCQSTCISIFGSVKDQAIQIFTSQLAYFLLANHPSNAVDNIALTTTIWANYTGNSFIKVQYCLISKTLKPFNFKAF